MVPDSSDDDKSQAQFEEALPPVAMAVPAGNDSYDMPKQEPKYVALVGSLPTTLFHRKRTWEVRTLAFGVYLKQDDILNGHNWFKHGTNTAVGLWYCTNNGGWVIGWAADRLISDPPLGWLQKPNGVWSVARANDWVPFNEVKLMSCYYESGKPTNKLRDSMFIPDNYASVALMSGTKKRMEPEWDKFLKFECSAEELVASRDKHVAAERMETNEIVFDVKRKFDEWYDSKRKTARLWKELEEVSNKLEVKCEQKPESTGD